MKKTILISGASSGFGYATAEKFVNHGDNLIILARRLKRLEEFYNKYKDSANIYYKQLDVRDFDQIKNLIEELPENFKDIDVLINNAGLALGIEKADKASLEDWLTMIDTNIKGLIYLTKLILPIMVKRNKGYIINIGSIAGTYPYPGGNVYCASKAFIKQFSLALRADLLGRNIRVTNIEPGLSETEFSIVRYKGDTEKASKLYKGTKPLKGEDIADIIYFLVNLQEHVNVNRIEIMPTCQSFSPLAVYKDEKS
ncbi:MAG: SDR family oxidoreductase [Deferribacterota bacterium]|nr:SDR family oxidoreductase [Deferribacterota bacterium]